MSNPLRRHYTKIYILSALLVLTLIAAMTLGIFYLTRSGGDETDPPSHTTPPESVSQPPPPPTHEYSDVLNANTNRGSLVLVNSDRNFDPATAQNIVSFAGSAGLTLPGYRRYANSSLAAALAALGAEMRAEFPEGRSLHVIRIFSLYIEDPSEERSTGLTVEAEFRDVRTGGQFPVTAIAVREQYQWLLANAHRFGLVQRFPSTHSSITGHNRPGHFRYVGIPHATFMHNNNLVLEQYLYLLETAYNFDNRLSITLAGQRWQVYFVPARAEQTTAIPIPYGAEYVISGNNGGHSQAGFVVTVRVN